VFMRKARRFMAGLSRGFDPKSGRGGMKISGGGGKREEFDHEFHEVHE
jgi:hypothetical protein